MFVLQGYFPLLWAVLWPPPRELVNQSFQINTEWHQGSIWLLAFNCMQSVTPAVPVLPEMSRASCRQPGH